MDTNSAFEFFYNTMHNLMIDNIPKQIIKKNSNKPKWWSREWQRKKNRRDKLYKRKPKGQMTVEYSEACKQFNILNEKLYNEYIESVQRNIASNPAEFWNYAKLKTKSSSYPNEMHLNNTVASTPTEIVQFFADHFESLYTDVDENSIIDDTSAVLTRHKRDINITLFDIESAIQSMKSKTSVGLGQTKYQCSL